MSLTILTALYCPGRLGLHTVPPPGWLMGLFMCNLAGCYLWLALTMWLAMHAAMRADAAVTHMLTRFVRLPVPSTMMLDRARKFLANYEEVPFKEVLRLPFMKHDTQSKNSAGEEIDEDALRRMRYGDDVPNWYKQEKAVDQKEPYVESMMPYAARGNAPEHFEVYREIQNEWWPYDVYGRICVFLAIMHLMHAWTYQQLGHHFQETRAIFTAVIVVVPLSVLQQLVLTLDVIPIKGEMLPFNLARIGPFAQFFALFAMGIEYKRWYSAETQRLGYVLVYIAYIIHIIYTLQLLKLCWPTDRVPAPQETPGAAWWPSHWQLPAAFHHAVWLVAPPMELEPGQHDLVGEMREAGRHRGEGYGIGKQAEVLDAAKRQDVHRALGDKGESPAWRHVQVGLIAMVIGFVWLTLGFTYEVINAGTTHPSLLSAPGLPNMARDPRWRSPKFGREHPVEVGTGGMEHGPFVGEKGGHGGHGGGHDAGHGESHGSGHSDAHAASAGESHGASSASSHGGAAHAAEAAPSAEHASEAHAASSGHGHGRRLDEREVAQKIRQLLPHLQDLANGGLEMPATPSSSSTARPLPTARASVSWPPLFEPRLMACAPVGSTANGQTVMLSPHGRGALVSMDVADIAKGLEQLPAAAASFALEGVSGLGALVAAHWDDRGLLLATDEGATLECPGAGPTGSRWRCNAHRGARLALRSAAGERGSFAGKVAINRAKDGSYRAAVAFPGEDAMALFSRAADLDAHWLPSGEFGLPAGLDAPLASAAFEGSGEDAHLLLASADGTLTRMHANSGRMHSSGLAAVERGEHVWQASCGLSGGAHLAHLVRRPLDTAATSWQPTLLLEVAAA
eukprot:TRINITY_DN17437_c0_g1_i1.p1 TRINITY_DN17437_c0_g1~~TRINITY_DN17437_c0_g1_i1.p1  ORF type:complete len:973 (+),score=208.63 TRINITY_DN17437_c0_g1_i1:370-2919(+)